VGPEERIKMETEGIVELKELDRVIQECAAIKRERDKLREIKEDFEMELQKRADSKSYLDEVIKERDALRVLLQRLGYADIRTRTMDKGDLEKAIRQFYKYEAVQIEKVCVGSPDTASYVYSQKADPRLLLKVDILFEEKEE
jgi:hypothetical protein